MSSTTRSLGVVAFLLLLFGGGLLFLTGGGRQPVASTPVLRPEPTSLPEPVASVQLVELIPPAKIEVSAEEVARTSVLWPLRVELDLLEASYLPSTEGGTPIGSGASAKLLGRIMGSGDQGARARIEFVAGPNAGRVLLTDVTGSFGATDLYPGLSIVEVHGDGILGSRREVRLRQERETLLNIGYGRPGSVEGRVQDRDGAGLEGAAVTVDGTRVTTGPDGFFFLGSVASGQVLVEVEFEGYAAYQELAWVAAGKPNAADRMTFTLQPEATMQIVIDGNAGGPGPVQVILLPGQESQRLQQESAHRNMRYPWHALNPIEVYPGSPKTVTGLPAEVVKVYAFRPGAEGAMQVVNLRTGRPGLCTLHLEPAPRLTGIVTLGGQPAADAIVRLEAPNRVRAALSYFREGSQYLETAVMPSLPPAVQEVRTNANGRYTLTAWADQSATRYLEARGADGRTWAGRLVQKGEEVVDLDLKEVDLGDADLSLEFPGRFQGLPLEVVIEGAPHDPWILPPQDELVVGDLLDGRWHLKLTWHGTPIFEETLEIGAGTRREVELPAECVEGQDEEAWRRAGREYPQNP